MTTPDDELAPPANLLETVERVLDWFVPETLQRNPEAKRRARLVVAAAILLIGSDLVTLMLVPWAPWVQVGRIVLPRPAVTALTLHLIVNVSITWMVKATGRAKAGAFWLQASLLLFFACLAYFRGGFESPILWWMCAVPMLTAFLSGPRAATVMGGAVAVVLALFWTLASQHHPFPPVDPADLELLDVLYSQFVLLGFVAFVGRYYEHTREAVSDDLTQAYSQLETTNQALRASQLNIRQIAEHIGQAIWMHDLRLDRVVYANVGFEQIFHLSRARLEGDPRVWLQRAHPDDDERLPRMLDGLDHEYRIQIGEEVRWIRHSVYGVGEGGTATRAIHIAADVTLRRAAAALRERFIETVLEVQENERRHLARELHDDTGGSLTALLVGLRGLGNTLERDDQQLMLTQLSNQLRTVVADIGRLARGLHPSVLDELGLLAAIRRLAGDATETSGVVVEVRASGMERERTLSATVRLAAYRIIQEALTNVARHAKATHVDVTVALDPTQVQVRVEDDGRGFDPSKIDKTRAREVGIGLGLMSMRERATLLGGTVDIESAPGRGTTVIGEIPLVRPTITDNLDVPYLDPPSV